VTPSNGPRLSFREHLLRNLRITGLLTAVVTVAVGGYALLNGEPFEWEIIMFVAVGMTLSSVINALIDSRRRDDGV